MAIESLKGDKSATGALLGLDSVRRCILDYQRLTPQELAATHYAGQAADRLPGKLQQYVATLSGSAASKAQLLDAANELHLAFNILFGCVTYVPGLFKHVLAAGLDEFKRMAALREVAALAPVLPRIQKAEAQLREMYEEAQRCYPFEGRCASYLWAQERNDLAAVAKRVTDEVR